MAVIHDFETPRNLYEKLKRDDHKLNLVIDGDNVFDFVSTAFHLQHWIKNSPMSSSETIKRMLRKLSQHPYIKHCKNICQAKEKFKIEIAHDKTAKMYVGADTIDVDEFKTEIMTVYESYFRQRGH